MGARPGAVDATASAPLAYVASVPDGPAAVGFEAASPSALRTASASPPPATLPLNPAAARTSPGGRVRAGWSKGKPPAQPIVDKARPAAGLAMAHPRAVGRGDRRTARSRVTRSFPESRWKRAGADPLLQLLVVRMELERALEESLLKLHPDDEELKKRVGTGSFPSRFRK